MLLNYAHILGTLRVDQHVSSILENLQNNRDLETTFYVTDSRQKTDFYWFRESGIRINVGLDNIQLIPIYEQSTDNLGGDNDYVIQNPGTAEDKRDFLEIVRNHCRYRYRVQFI